MVESIKLTMYKNGLMIKRGPFRPAGSESFNSFARDIMDGYFPGEFRDSSPDGVLLELTDKREEYFKDNTSTESSYHQSEMKAAQLLERLPKTVIKNGDIVSVRGDIRSKITCADVKPSGESKTEASKQIASGKQVVHLSTRAKIAIQNNEDTADEVITSIQVKWHNGTDVFILKMFGSDLVKHIKEAICEYFSDQDHKQDPPDFSLRCAYPPRDLPDDVTLIAAKLVPSGTLHVKLM
jgi:UBX domain-containing protein 11